jgi:energy-coupling factor transporter ATP-binding protein EcfA2
VPDPNLFHEYKDSFFEKSLTIIFGPPSIGKSYFLYNSFTLNEKPIFVAEDNFLNNNGETAKVIKTEDFINTDLSSHHIFVVDDFYKVIKRNLLQGEIFLKTMNKYIAEYQTKFVLSTTPYRWDWLSRTYVNSENFKNIKTNMNYFFCSQSKNDITEDCNSILNKEITNKIIKLCNYKFKFSKEIFKDPNLRDYQTYIKPSHFLLSDYIPNTRFGSIPDLSIETMAKIMKADVNNLVMIKGAFEEIENNPVLLKNISKTITTTIIPLHIVASIFDIWNTISGKESAKNITNLYTDFTKFPAHRLEIMECESKLPPCSLIKTKEMIMEGDTKIEAIANELKKFKKETEQLRKTYQNEFEVLKKQITIFNEEINKKTIDLEIFINDNIKNSLKNLTDPQEEEGLKKILPDHSIIPFLGRETEIRKICDEWVVKGQKLIVIKGEPGVGKSTLVFHISKELQKKGYIVGIPDFTSSPEFLKMNLKRRLSSSQGKTILIVDLKPKETKEGYTSFDINGLKLIFNFLREGIVSTVIMISRNVTYQYLEEMFREIRSDETYFINSVCQNLKTMILNGLREEDIDAILKKIWYGEEEIIDKNLKDILRIGKETKETFNPLLSILATKWVIDYSKEKNDFKRKPLVNLTKDQFLENYVDFAFFLPDKIDDAAQDAFKFIVVARRLKKSDLLTLLDLNSIQTKFEKIKSIIIPYQSDGFYQIYPDIFNDVIFKTHCYKNLDNYIDIFIEKNLYQYLSDIAFNLKILFISIKNQMGEVNTLIGKAEEFMKKMQKSSIPQEDYVNALSPLFAGGIPITLTSNDFKIIYQMVTDKNKDFPDYSELVLIEVFAFIPTNFLFKNDLNLFDKILNDMIKIAYENASEWKFDKEQFILNIYLKIVWMISEKYSPDEAINWLYGVINHAYKKASEWKFDKENFFLNIYSYVIYLISEKHSPEEAMNWLDALINHAYKKASEWKFDKEKFFLNIYSHIIYLISEKHSPEEAMNWLDALINHAYHKASEWKFDKEKFLVNIYSIFIYRILDEHSPKEVKSWLDATLNHAHKKANEWKFNKKTFLMNIYSHYSNLKRTFT